MEGDLGGLDGGGLALGVSVDDADHCRFLVPLYCKTIEEGRTIFSLVNGNRFLTLRTHIEAVRGPLDVVESQEEAWRILRYVTRALKLAHETPLFPIAPTLDDCFINGQVIYFGRLTNYGQVKGNIIEFHTLFADVATTFGMSIVHANEFQRLVVDICDGKHKSLRSIFMSPCLLTQEMRRFMVETLHYTHIPDSLSTIAFIDVGFADWKMGYSQTLISRSENSRGGASNSRKKKLGVMVGNPYDHTVNDYVAFVRNIWSHEREYRNWLQTLLNVHDVSDGRYVEYYFRTKNPLMFQNLLTIWARLKLPSLSFMSEDF